MGQDLPSLVTIFRADYFIAPTRQRSPQESTQDRVVIGYQNFHS